MKLYLLLFTASLFSGCASLGLTTPQTLDQKIGYAYVGITTALTTVTTAVSAGQITSTQASNANTMILNAKGILDTARDTEGDNQTAAANDIVLATAALTSVQQYLTNNGVK